MARLRWALSSLSRKYWWIVAGLIPVWMGFVGFIGPWVIGELYEGRGPGFLVAQLGARQRVPLSDYLWEWGRMVRLGTFFLVFAVAGGYLALRLVTAVWTPVRRGEGEEDRLEVRRGTDAAA